MTRQEAIGEKIKELREKNLYLSAAECADIAVHMVFTQNPKDFHKPTRAEYLKHLEEQGDKYSLEMKSAIERGETLEQDPSGN